MKVLDLRKLLSKLYSDRRWVCTECLCNSCALVFDVCCWFRFEAQCLANSLKIKWIRNSKCKQFIHTKIYSLNSVVQFQLFVYKCWMFDNTMLKCHIIRVVFQIRIKISVRIERRVDVIRVELTSCQVEQLNST